MARQKLGAKNNFMLGLGSYQLRMGDKPLEKARPLVKRKAEEAGLSERDQADGELMDLLFGEGEGGASGHEAQLHLQPADNPHLPSSMWNHPESSEEEERCPSLTCKSPHPLGIHIL